MYNSCTLRQNLGEGGRWCVRAAAVEIVLLPIDALPRVVNFWLRRGRILERDNGAHAGDELEVVCFRIRSMSTGLSASKRETRHTLLARPPLLGRLHELSQRYLDGRGLVPHICHPVDLWDVEHVIVVIDPDVGTLDVAHGVWPSVQPRPLPRRRRGAAECACWVESLAPEVVLPVGLPHLVLYILLREPLAVLELAHVLDVGWRGKVGKDENGGLLLHIFGCCDVFFLVEDGELGDRRHVPGADADCWFGEKQHRWCPGIMYVASARKMTRSESARYAVAVL